jgi:hypothetical protein
MATNLLPQKWLSLLKIISIKTDFFNCARSYGVNGKVGAIAAGKVATNPKKFSVVTAEFK